MPHGPRPNVLPAARLLLAVVTASAWAAAAGHADTVRLKNGIVYQGTLDRDNTLLWVFDGLKRVVIYDSKVEKIEPNAAFRTLETFEVNQPLLVHAGQMPKEVLKVEAEPWNDKGRRMFRYVGSRVDRTTTMEQAIYVLGPHLSKIRGIDGFWVGQVATDQIPRDVVLAILARVERDNQKERLRVARLLIEAGWYKEARAELDAIRAQFADDQDLRARVEGARQSIAQLEGVGFKAAIDQARSAQQWALAASKLKSFPEQDVDGGLVAQVQEMERADQAQAAADRMVSEDLRAAADLLPRESAKIWEKRILEALKALKDAPDAVRDRFIAFQKAKAEGSGSPEALFALGMSGFLVGSDAATKELETASTMWSMRDLVRTYLASPDLTARSEALEKLETASLPANPAMSDQLTRLDVVTRLARNAPPPLHDDRSPADAKPERLHRVGDDSNDEPTEYTVVLPPEYHPLRSYPAVVALHDGNGPRSALDWLSAEAARRGYIVVSPEYLLPGQGKEYGYSESEHAAVELSLRDARRRYSIDSDRVFLAGQLNGANMAWDFGLSHPDLFAGVVIISGFPFKYAFPYLPNAAKLPLYVVVGDLAPASNEVVYGQVLKPLIAKVWDVTYLEYLKRGLEPFPEEVGPSFDWMDRKKRDPYPKTFDYLTARACDNRFFGVVVREHQTGRSTTPSAVEPFGKNVRPAKITMKSSSLSNLLNVQVDGLKRLDVWVPPTLIDFKKPIEVRVNGRPKFKGTAKPELAPLLEDLRLRGDRKQVYWMKVPVG